MLVLAATAANRGDCLRTEGANTSVRANPHVTSPVLFNLPKPAALLLLPLLFRIYVAVSVADTKDLISDRQEFASSRDKKIITVLVSDHCDPACACNREVKSLNTGKRNVIDGFQFVALCVARTIRLWITLSCDVFMKPVRRILNLWFGDGRCVR